MKDAQNPNLKSSFEELNSLKSQASSIDLEKEKKLLFQALAKKVKEKERRIPYFLWVRAYWNVRGKSLDFTKHAYLKQIYEDQSPEIVYEKSAQSGFTERMITEALWLPDQYKENSLYIFPTSGTVSDLVQERVDEPINNDPYLAFISGRAKKLLGKQADKIQLKRMAKGFVYFRGSNKPTQITSVSADAIFVDELDRMEQENVPYFAKRYQHSARKWARWASTPTIPGFGIDAKFRESDQHYLYIKCPICREWQKLTFWDNVDKERKLLVCKLCRNKLVPWECKLEWNSENKGGRMRGYHINQLYSPFLNLEEMIKESNRSSEWDIMQFYNQGLGLPYEPKGSKITEGDIQACVRDYKAPIKSKEGFMGIDVGKVLHVLIRDKERILYIGEHTDFDEVNALMDQYNIKVAVIDALPETRKSQEFANKFRGRVYMCYYSGFKEVKKGEWFKAEDQKVNTDRTISLDYSQNEIKTQGILMPSNLPEGFKEHLKNLVRVIKEKEGGEKIAEYIRTGDDHYRHSLNYAKIAKEIFCKVPLMDLFSI